MSYTAVCRLRRFLLPESLFVLATVCFSSTLSAQTTDPLHIDTQGKVGIGTTAPGEQLEVKGNTFFNGDKAYIRFSHKYGNADDGKIGNSMFHPGLNVVGINDDNTYRKIQLWGTVIQNQNDGTNTWIGPSKFDGVVNLTNTLSVTGATSLTGDVKIGAATAGYKFSVKGTALIEGDYLFVKSETAGRLRVGAVFNTPGLFAGEDGAQNLALGVRSGRKVFFGWENKDAYVEGGTGNAYFKGNVNLNRLGIGTTDPQAPIHVTSNKGSGGSYNEGLELGWGRGNDRNIYPGRGFGTCAIFAVGDIVTQNALISTKNNVTSDIRLKKDISHSSSKTDLDILKTIEVFDYKLIDTITDNNLYKKAIAQQIKKVYPQATSTMNYTIPDVYQLASAKQTGSNEYKLVVAKTHQLKSGDKVELKCDPGSNVTVLVGKVLSPSSFTVNTDRDLTKEKTVFVFGKEVDDLLTVDYDALSMLNISATQELARQVEDQQKHILQLEQQLKLRKTEVEQLKIESIAVKNTNERNQARLTVLEEKIKKILSAIEVTASN